MFMIKNNIMEKMHFHFLWAVPFPVFPAFILLPGIFLPVIKMEL